MAANMTRLPVTTSAQAPHAIACVCARTIGSPNAEITRMHVMKMHVSAQALLVAEKDSPR